MSAVVLRCARCGTTQSSPGECEACHEGQVHYYCTNHTPGRWLDGQVCSQCGVAYGRTDPRPTPPRPSQRAPDRTTPRKIESAPRTSSARDRLSPWGRKSPSPPPREGPYEGDEVVVRAKALRRLHDLLTRSYGRRRMPDDLEMPSHSVAPLIAGGCLRMVLMIFLFFLLTFFGLSFLGSFLMLGH